MLQPRLDQAQADRVKGKLPLCCGGGRVILLRGDGLLKLPNTRCGLITERALWLFIKVAIIGGHIVSCDHAVPKFAISSRSGSAALLPLV